MRYLILGQLTLFIFFSFTCPVEATNTEDFPVIKGPYLGQKPPGVTVEIFAPGIISTAATEFANTFSPDGRIFFFTRYSESQKTATTIITQEVRSRWTPPKPAPFSAPYDEVDPIFSTDGNKVFYSSRRPLKGNSKAKDDYDLWYVTRTKNGWSQPANLGTVVNSERNEFYPSLTRNGTLYFVSNRKGGYGKMDFYKSEFIKGKYCAHVNLGRAINTAHREGDGFIAPNESYFLFSAFIPGNYGSGDFYISYKKPDGSWTQAKNVGKILNTAGNEFTPWVSMDNKYLFFASDRSGNDEIYWVDAKILKNL